MKRYRFFYIQGGQKWYLMPIKSYDAPAEFCLDTARAGVFTEADWEEWGSRYEREEIGEDEEMRRAGMPMLPGMEQ